MMATMKQSATVHVCLTNDYKNTISHISIMNTSQNIFNNFTHQMMINSSAKLLIFWHVHKIAESDY